MTNDNNLVELHYQESGFFRNRVEDFVGTALVCSGPAMLGLATGFALDTLFPFEGATENVIGYGSSAAIPYLMEKTRLVGCVLGGVVAHPFLRLIASRNYDPYHE